MVWMGVTYDNISICKECGSVYNFGGINLKSASLLGIDLGAYKMKGPSGCSQQALLAKKRLESMQWTPEQHRLFGRMLDAMRRDDEEAAKHPHAYPIWRVTYNG